MRIALIAGLAVLLVIVVIALIQRSGPRVTTIERTREADDEPDERG